MKETPRERQVADRMAPGGLSAEGFLGDDPRPVGRIIDEDAAALARLGVEPARLAAAMRAVMDRAMAAQGTPVPVGEGLTAVYREAMGRIPCPWADARAAKGLIEVQDSRTGRAVLRFSPLSVHLIAAHGFFQGRGSPFRLDPADLCRALALTPNEAD